MANILQLIGKRELAMSDFKRGQRAKQPNHIPLRGWWDIAKRIVKQMSHDNLSLVAAGVAFYALLAIFPAIAAYYCWQKAIELIGPNRSSMFIQLMPLFSALMAIIIFKEKFQLFHFIGATFIISGIYLSNRKIQ